MASPAPNLIPLPSTPANEWALGTNEILNAHVTRTPLLTPDPPLPGAYPHKKPGLSLYGDNNDALLDAARAALTEIRGYFATARTHSATAEDLDIPTRLARPVPPVFVRAYSDFGARPSHVSALAPRLQHHLAPRPPLSSTSSFSATSGMYSDFSSPALASTPTPPLLSPELELELESPETVHPVRAAYGYFAPSRTHPARPPVLVRTASSPSPSFFNASSTSLAAPARPPLSTTSSFSATSGMYSSDSDVDADVEFSRRASPSLHSAPAPDDADFPSSAPLTAPVTQDRGGAVSPTTRARLREEGGVPLVHEAGGRGGAPNSMSFSDADADADVDTATTDPANEHEQEEDERAEDAGNATNGGNQNRRARFVARIKDRMNVA